MKDCFLAPYYPTKKKQEYDFVHKVFGYKKLERMLRNLDEQGRKKAIESFDWEAKMWKQDPINGPLGAFTEAQNEIARLQNLLQQQQDQTVPSSDPKFMGLAQNSFSFNSDAVPVSSNGNWSSFEAPFVANNNVVHNPYFEYPYGGNSFGSIGALQNEETNLLNCVVAGPNVWQPSQPNYLQSLASSSGTKVTVDHNIITNQHMGMQGEGQQHSNYYSFGHCKEFFSLLLSLVGIDICAPFSLASFLLKIKCYICVLLILSSQFCMQYTFF